MAVGLQIEDIHAAFFRPQLEIERGAATAR